MFDSIHNGQRINAITRDGRNPVGTIVGEEGDFYRVKFDDGATRHPNRAFLVVHKTVAKFQTFRQVDGYGVARQVNNVIC